MKCEETSIDYWNRVLNLLGRRSLKDLAEATGIPYQSVTGWKTKHRIPKYEEGYKIARYLNTSMDYLFAGDESWNISKEALAVEKDGSLKYIVRLCMDRPEFLQIIKSVLDSRIEVEKGRAE